MNELQNTTVGQHLLGYINESQQADAKSQGLSHDFMHMIGYLDENHFEETAKLFHKQPDSLRDLREISKSFDKNYGTDMESVVEDAIEFLFS